ncbi:MAG: 4Fe-4S dicluster domain-containing protein [Planctomycetota bacterium]
MAIIKVKDNNPVAAIQELLCSMLSEGLVSAVLVPQEIPSKKTVVQSLVQDPAKLNAVNLLAPVFSVNSARIIAKMCVGQMSSPPLESVVAEQPEQESEKQVEPTAAENETPEQKEERTPEQEQNEPEEQVPVEASTGNEQNPAATEGQLTPGLIAVVLRPCELRTLVELVKLQQASLDRFVVIGVDCWGTYSVEDYAAKVGEDSQDSSVTADFLKQVTAGNFPEDLRGVCRTCQYPAPMCADMTIQFIGEDISKQISVQAHTEKGKTLFDALGLEVTPESKEREDALAKLKEAKKQLAEQDQVDFLETISSLCINCHNCRAVCPICYCKQCVFDGQVFEYPLEKYLNWSGKKGLLPMPPDKLLFHLTRMSHVATSCVACGQCEAACPNGIPLGQIYQKISAAAQEALGYEAGRSLDEELPLTTFREDELSIVEN